MIINIKTPQELCNAIQMAVGNEDNEDYIWAIHKYKWYNWYQNIHIKKDSQEDIENTLIFESLEKEHPEIHKKVEDNIDNEINEIENDFE